MPSWIGSQLAMVAATGSWLVDLLDKVPAAPRLEILDVLQRLAGDQGPDTKHGSLPPAKERELWHAWWQAHGSSVYRLEPPRGHTLITLFDLRANQGEVLEVDANQKTQWRITGLGCPVDAQVVGKDRVLIAEYMSQRVTERDFEGTIYWEKQVRGPIGWQRLANGNVFIATCSQLLGVDRGGKMVFTYVEPRDVVLAARKLATGQMLLLTGSGMCKCLDATGDELRQFSVGAVNVIGINFDVLAGGHVLIPEFRGNRVVEYDRYGNKIWQADAWQPTSAVRLANGHVLVASQRGIVEFDRQRREVWQLAVGGRQWCARRR
jgi:PQQ-like domain